LGHRHRQVLAGVLLPDHEAAARILLGPAGVALSVLHHLAAAHRAGTELGSFDVVLFLGVLYHLRHPLLALERVAAVTGELLILETEVDLAFAGQTWPVDDSLTRPWKSRPHGTPESARRSGPTQLPPDGVRARLGCARGS